MTRLLVASLVCLLGLAACTSQLASTHVTMRTSPATAPASSAAPLEIAIRDGRDLGVMPATQQLSFDLTLADRDPAGLAAAMSGGSPISAAVFAGRYGPDPVRVAATVRVLATAGLAARWSPGDVLLHVTGPASAVERFLGVSIHRFIAVDGAPFYAALDRAGDSAVDQPHRDRRSPDSMTTSAI